MHKDSEMVYPVYLGCYGETPDHTAIPLLKIYGANMQFQECFNDMLDLGCPIFTFVTEDIGIGANVNKCYAAPTLDTYAQYGPSTECSKGKPNWPPGGIIANEVYQIKGNLSGNCQ